MKPAIENRQSFFRLISFLFVVVLSVLIYSLGDRAEELGAYGYPGIFLFALITSATVILPAPGLILVFSMGAVFNPGWVAVAAGSGAALGELSGYLAGFSGQGVIENTNIYNRIRTWMETHPRISGWLILFLAFVPLPFFDMAGMAAGALRMPVTKFLIWVWVGKIFKMLVVAFLGNAWFSLFD